VEITQWGNLNMPISIHSIIVHAAAELSKKQLTYDELKNKLEKLQEYFDHAARQDELMRIKAATLDADNDVWSITDDCQVISLNDRVEELLDR
jgi:hypothetical protein